MDRSVKRSEKEWARVYPNINKKKYNREHKLWVTCLPKKTEETNERLVLPELVTNMSTAWNKRIILIDEENPDNDSTQ